MLLGRVSEGQVLIEIQKIKNNIFSSAQPTWSNYFIYEFHSSHCVMRWWQMLSVWTYRQVRFDPSST